MKFVCTNCVKADDGNLVIACFEVEESVVGEKVEPFKFTGANVDGAKLVAVDPYGVITILADPDDTVELFSAEITTPDGQKVNYTNSDGDHAVEVGIILSTLS